MAKMWMCAAGMAAATVLSGCSHMGGGALGPVATAPNPIPEAAPGVDYASLASIVNRLKCDVYNLNKAVEAQSLRSGKKIKLKPVEGKLTFNVSVVDDLDGKLGVEIAPFGGKASLGGEWERGHGRTRTVAFEFKADPSANPNESCRKGGTLQVKQARGMQAPKLADVASTPLFTYISLEPMRAAVEKDGATVNFGKVTYSGDFVVTDKRTVSGGLTIVVFSAGADKSYSREATQSFELTVEYEGDPSQFKSPII